MCRRLLLALGVLAVSACEQDDPFRPVATFESVITEVGMAALSTGAAAPTALDLITLRAVRPNLDGAGEVNFQLALDLDAEGRVRLLPALAMLNPPGGAISVGLQRSTSDFSEVLRAPTTGFVTDSLVVADVGETVLVRVSSTLCSFGEPFYGKLVVDEVNTFTRRLFVRFLINRNCGYSDLTLGLPRN